MRNEVKSGESDCYPFRSDVIQRTALYTVLKYFPYDSGRIVNLMVRLNKTYAMRTWHRELARCAEVQEDNKQTFDIVGEDGYGLAVQFWDFDVFIGTGTEPADETKGYWVFSQQGEWNWIFPENEIYADDFAE